VIEVVSARSEYRDYVEKLKEYRDLGVKEYWIVDAEKRQIVVARSSSKRTIQPPQTYRTRLLPGFELDIARVFAPAEAADE